MNYIEQIKGFWLAQEAYQLGTSEIALYFHLLEVCNKTGWTGTFYRNNYKVMSDLSIRSYKTMQSVRDRLKNAGIIDFSQKNGDANCKYELLDLSKKYLGKGKGSVEGKGKGSVEGKGKGSVEVNINQTKTKPNQTSKSHCGKPQEEKILYWKSMIEVWANFYEDKFSEKYLYLDKDFAHFKKIHGFLKKRASLKEIEFSEENLKASFNFFLKMAWGKDEWIRQNFTPSTILSKFNQIANGQGTTKNNRELNADYKRKLAERMASNTDKI